MSEDNKASLFVGAVGVFGFICFVAGGIVTESRATDRLRKEAVEHNAAEYYLDQNNQRQWRWKGEPK